MVDLTEKLQNVLSQQSEDFSSIGMFECADIYTLNGADPWVNYADPGPHRAGIDGTLNAVQQRDATELYNANKLVFDSQRNVR